VPPSRTWPRGERDALGGIKLIILRAGPQGVTFWDTYPGPPTRSGICRDSYLVSRGRHTGGPTERNSTSHEEKKILLLIFLVVFSFTSKRG